VSPTTPSLVTPHHTRPTPGLLPGHLCPPRSAGLAARQQPPGPLKLGCPPPLHAQALAQGPLAAVRLHRAVGSGTAHAAVRRLCRCCQRGRAPAHVPQYPPSPRKQLCTRSCSNKHTHPQPQAGSQDNCNGKLLLQQLDRLHLAFKRSQVSPSVSSSSQDQQSQHLPKSVIPTQCSVMEQLIKNWQPLKVLCQGYTGNRFEEHHQLHLPQKHKATVADSTLHVEMNGLEEQADNVKARELFWKPLSWLCMMMIH